MIVALCGLLALLLMGGHGGATLSNIEEGVKDQVPDKVRRAEILDISKQLEDELRTIEKRLNAHFDEFAKVETAYGSVDADFDAVTAKLRDDARDTSKAVLDAREGMREQMTRAEWDAVFKAGSLAE